MVKSVLGTYKGSRTKLLLEMLRDEIKPAKNFEPEPQPQDTGDLLAELINLFLGEVNEISDVINSINKEQIVLHSVKSAESEIKNELMKIMAAKQKEIMLKYGLQVDQNEQEEGQILGTLDLMRAFSVPTSEGNKNVSIRMGELMAK